MELLAASGANHFESTGFELISFASICEAAARPVDLSAYPVDEQGKLASAKKACPFFVPCDLVASKKKADIEAHNHYTFLVSDIDDGNKEIEDVASILAGQGIESYAIYSTVSSTSQAKRWRVVVPVSSALDLDHWQTLQAGLASLLDGDDCTARSQQISYLPALSVANLESYAHQVKQGAPVDVFNSKLAQFSIELAARQRKEIEETERQAKPAEAKPVELAEGQVSPIDAFNGSVSWPDLLGGLGYKRRGQKWLFPESTSGAAGVFISYRDDQNGRYLSQHTSDPLCDGFTHDKFDVYRVMVHCGNFDAALQDVASKLTTRDGLTLTEFNQEKHKEALRAADRWDVDFSQAIQQRKAEQKQPEDRKKLKRPKLPDMRENGRGQTVPACTSDNLIAALAHYGIEAKLNLMTTTAELFQNGIHLDVSQSQVRSYVVDIAERCGVPKSAIDEHLSGIAERSSYHPIAELLNTAGGWDGVNRVEPFIDCLHGADKEAARIIMRKWLISAVASLYEPDFSAKLVPVLKGEQSYMKTAAIRKISRLIPGSFGEGYNLDANNRDSVAKIIKCFVVELGELETTTKREAGTLKAFITNSEDVIRLPYARTETIKKRQTAMIGTVNRDDFLKDETGSVRFGVIEMTQAADIETINQLLGWKYKNGRERRANTGELIQFWLEVKDMYDRGEDWNLTAQERERIAAGNEKFTDKGDFYQKILELHIEMETGKTEWMKAAEVANLIGAGNKTRVVGRALAKLVRDGKTEAKKARGNVTLYKLKVRPLVVENLC